MSGDEDIGLDTGIDAVVAVGLVSVNGLDDAVTFVSSVGVCGFDWLSAC